MADHSAGTPSKAICGCISYAWTTPPPRLGYGTFFFRKKIGCTIAMPGARSLSER